MENCIRCRQVKVCNLFIIHILDASALKGYLDYIWTPKCALLMMLKASNVESIPEARNFTEVSIFLPLNASGCLPRQELRPWCVSWVWGWAWWQMQLQLLLNCRGLHAKSTRRIIDIVKLYFPFFSFLQPWLINCVLNDWWSTSWKTLSRPQQHPGAVVEANKALSIRVREDGTFTMRWACNIPVEVGLFPKGNL